MAKRDLSGAIDFDYLSNYTAGDLPLIDEVLGIFEEQGRLWLRLLDPEAGDGWRDAAHTIKGAALGIGAHDLAKVCGEAEAETSGNVGVRKTLADQVHTALNAVNADISAWRHEQLLQGLKG
jgi:HPt (histidine-containing phosphotransfer) domain-containing protein